MKPKTDFKKLALYGLIVSLILSAGAGIYVMLFGEFKDTEINILLTTMSLGIFSLCGLCCSFLYNKNRYIGLSLVGLIFSVATFFYSILLIWFWPNDDVIIKSFFLSLLTSLGLAHGCLMLLIVPARKLILYLRTGTFFFIIAFAAIMSIIILTDDVGENDFILRLLGVSAILMVLGSILTPILHKVLPVRISNQENETGS